MKFWQRYSEVLAIMEIAFGVDDFHKSSFSARLSYLRRPEIGCVPMAKQEGKNRLTFYNESALNHLFLAMVLNFNLGWDPKNIGKLYKTQMPRINPETDKKEIVPFFNVDEWFSNGNSRILEGFLDSMELEFSRGPSVKKKYEPFIVMFQATIGFENKDEFLITSVWAGTNLDRLKEGHYTNPCSTFLDFTYLAAWLKLAIREWERAIQED